MDLKAAAKNATFVDVRTLMEYNLGHMPNCKHIPLDELPARWKSIPGIGEKPIIFYCRSGNRSGQAVQYLQQLGVAEVYNGGSMEEALFLTR